MNTADVLDKAADVIVKRGWGQGRTVSFDVKGPKCVALAIRHVAHSPGDKVAADRALTRWLSLPPSAAPAAMVLVYWNDHPSRTADEVLAALRECAANLRAAP